MIENEIRRKIEDFRELGLLDFIPRMNYVHEVKNSVSTIVGARRSGKSYRAKQIIFEAIKNKTIDSLNNVVYLDFDNPILEKAQSSDLQLIQHVLFKITPSITLKTPLIFVLDELHKIDGWEQYVIELSRNPFWKVYVTGSSSKLLVEDIATELRGKSISSIMYPLTFTEYLKFCNHKEISFSTKGNAELLRHFDNYLEFGSFPAIPETNERTKELLLRDYFNTMLLKDIIQRHNVSKPNQCTSLYKYLISCISKSYTIQSAYNHIRQSGMSTNKDSIKDYIKWAEDAWFLFSIPIYSDSIKQAEQNYKKSYCIDWALANFNSPTWDGHLTRAFENIIFIHLKQFYSNVNYYLTRTDRKEVDFIVSDTRKVPQMLIQVSMDISNKKTLNRELAPLLQTAKYFNTKENYIITYNHEDTYSSEGIKVYVLPAYKWLLNLST